MTQPPSPLTMLLSRHTRRRDFVAPPKEPIREVLEFDELDVIY